MTHRYMLDTDTCSFVIKRSHPTVTERLRSLPVSHVCASIITQAELRYGVELSPRREEDEKAVDGFLRQLAILAFGEAAAVHYAVIRAALKRRGTMIGANNLLIAAHARSLDVTLVTNNTREFGRVEGLNLENWAG